MKKTQKSGLQNVLDTIHVPLWLVIVLAITFILRIPSFFEPFSYGDEMIYLTLGEGIRRGLTLYRDIHDNKPPLLYFMAAVAGNVFWFRAILAAWTTATTVIFWKLTRVLKPKNDLFQKVSTAIFAILTTIPLLEGQVSNAELFMIGPTILAIYLLLSKKPGVITIFLSGILFSIATLFKVPAAFDLGVVIFIWLFSLKPSTKSVSKFILKVSILLLGFLLPILITLLWYYLKGALHEYLVAAFLQNVGYLSSWRPDDVQKPFLVKNAPLLTRAAIVTFGASILIWFRKKLSAPYALAVIWLLTSLFAITLSERPYPHYLIQAVPAISILVGFLVAAKNREQSLAVIPLFLLAVVPVYYNFWYYPSLPYYQRFFDFATHKISREEYFNRFDGNVNRNYKVARFIVSTSKPNDNVFVWGDSSPIYALSRHLPPTKYVANYHISDFSSQEEILNMLIENKPVLIVILSESPDFPQMVSFLNSNYTQIANIDGTQIWKLINPLVLNLIR